MGRTASGSSSINTFMTTVSPVGFTAGDLVYNTPQGIGVITNTPTGTASFPTFANQTFSPVGTQSLAGSLKYVENYGGSTVAQCVANLTNGNIVMAYGLRSNPIVSGAATAYFKITDTSDNIVVAQTLVSTVNQLNAGQPVGVLALPNGKFVIITLANQAGTERLSYAIYNNDGTVSTALTFDSSFTGSGNVYNLAFAARSDSSFVVATLASGPTPVYRVISSAGAVVYSGTFGALAGTAGFSSVLSVVVRPDDSFVVTSCSPGSLLYWQIFSSTNASLGSGSFTPSGGSYGCKMVLEPSSVVRLVYNSPNGIYTRTITGTTISAETTLRAITLFQYCGFSVTSLGGAGGFVITYSADPSTYTSDATFRNGKLVYEFYNTSGTRVAGATPIKSINNYNQGGLVSGLVVGSEIRFYKSSATTFSSTYNYYPRGIYYAKVNTTSYAIVPFKTLSASIGSVTAAVGAYSRASSTVTSAIFTPASSSTTSVTVGPSTSTASTQYKSQTLVDANACYGAASAAMDNGDIVIAYLYTTGTGAYFSVYNSSGVLQTTVLVSTSFGNASYYNSVRCFQLPNGNLALFYRGSGNIIYFRIYSSSYALLYSGNLGSTVYTQATSWSASPIGVDGRFVIAYLDSGGAEAFSVYGPTGTIVASGGGAEGTGDAINVVGFRSGDFVTYYTASSYGTGRARVYGWAGGSTYTFYNSFSAGVTNPYFGSSSVAVTPDDIGFVFWSDASNYLQVYSVAAGFSGNTFYSTTNQSLNTSTSGSVGIGCTGNGDIVGFSSGVASALGQTTPTYYQVQSASGLENWNFSTTGVSLGGSSQNAAANNFSVSPYIGDSCIVAFLDASYRPNFVVFYASSSTYSAVLTAGVTPSTPTVLSYANRYTLMGVALTNCSAGGAGIIQTNGTAAISSSYPSMTAAPFEFRNNTTYGVSGTVSGRIVTMGS